MNADLRWKQGERAMVAFGREIACSCDVRTLANGRRRIWQPVRSTTREGHDGPYYDPCVFPVSPEGGWYVTSVEQTDPPNDYLGRVFIRTNAHQLCEEWEVEQDDGLYYLRPTGQYVDDWGYLLHNSSSPTTLGCLRVDSREEQMRMADECARRLGNLTAVTVEVVT